MSQNKNPKSPLYQATRMVYTAIETAYRYTQDETYIPTKEELELFRALEHCLLECHSTASFIRESMDKRVEGEAS